MMSDNDCCVTFGHCLFQLIQTSLIIVVPSKRDPPSYHSTGELTANLLLESPLVLIQLLFRFSMHVGICLF